MRILVVGSGGREHALVWKIAQSKLVDKIFCAPGNGGTALQAENIDIRADDIAGLVRFGRREKIDLTVVGPEVPLTLGIADEFEKCRLPVFGPNKAAAAMEGSKVFSKELMRTYGVPTADFKVFGEAGAACAYIEKAGAPCVVKADGLAAGKGVIVAKTVDEAKAAVRQIMEGRVFGPAGDRVIVEECLTGQEASILVLTDSKDVIPLATSQDHKRIFDNDEGPNTGGMGAYSPAPVVTPALFDEIMKKIVYRTIDGLVKEGITYRGILYAGVMLTKDGPKTLEFNARFGDPETEAILPRMTSDIVEAMLAAASGNLGKFAQAGGLAWQTRPCVCVVCAAEGYPGEYKKGLPVSGLDAAGAMQDVMIFHAGTKKKDAGVVTGGGRVLCVSALGAAIRDARDKAYQAVGKIHFEGMQYRTDIAAKAL
ncbi:MAG TPA: phosphoribosylamine--glycine ligase [Candidatus Omnitrophota bacterium]|nr:phosphoribosylamine--glycine ligase [Candidatus Omnitrophota bacterium]HQO37437.1 phosphoribosylamine--glycine ligase [Candidatus Omnitrophota bacterium]HQQ05686.1 phosphoribosylamine--glycine ligase [Candidatus Omnitrophota bacterium]